MSESDIRKGIEMYDPGEETTIIIRLQLKDKQTEITICPFRGAMALSASSVV
jgi:hypothetical protein